MRFIDPSIYQDKKKIAIVCVIIVILIFTTWALIDLLTFRIKSVSIATTDTPLFEICFNKKVNLDAVTVDSDYSVVPRNHSSDNEKCIVFVINDGNNIDDNVARITGYVSATSTNDMKIDRKEIAIRVAQSTADLSGKDLDAINRILQSNNDADIDDIIKAIENNPLDEHMPYSTPHYEITNSVVNGKYVVYVNIIITQNDLRNSSIDSLFETRKAAADRWLLENIKDVIYETEYYVRDE